MHRFISVILIPADQLMLFGFSLLLASLLGLGVATVYRYTHRSMNYESSFMSTLVLLTPIVTMVMFFIQGDLVLSLGLVGSLSIIRFRTPIKDTRDMVFLFWSIAAGLGSGTMQWTYTVLASLFITLLLTLFHYIKYGRQLHNEYILIISGGTPHNFSAIDHLVSHTDAQVQLRSHEIDGDSWELTYEFRFDVKIERRIQQIASDVHSVEGVRKVSLLSPQLTLPM